jgi:hypothetical protein
MGPFCEIRSGMRWELSAGFEFPELRQTACFHLSSYIYFPGSHIEHSWSCSKTPPHVLERLYQFLVTEETCLWNRWPYIYHILALGNISLAHDRFH